MNVNQLPLKTGKRTAAFLAILSLIILVLSVSPLGAEEDVEPTSASQEPFSTLAASSDPVNVTLSPPSAAKFPTVEVYTLVTDENGEAITGLDASNFTLTEKAEDETSPTKEQISVSTVSKSGKIAVALGIDRSNSMSGDLPETKDAAKTFIDKLGSLDRAAVISFEDSEHLDQDFTSDKTSLKNTIDSLSLEWGTALYGAIYKGVQEANKEVGVKAVVVFTDGKSVSDTKSKQQAISIAQEKGIPVYTIGLGGGVNESVLKEIANKTGGFYTSSPSASDLEQVYNDISQAIQNQYLISYKTHNDDFDGTQRTVKVDVTKAGNSDSDTTTYTVTQPPQISLTQNTKDLLNDAQYADQSLTIEANITDDNGVSAAKLFYRVSGSGSSYTEVTMSSSSGSSLYSADIPKSEVINPGVDFYITASDGTLTTSSPANNPSQYPHQIAILPNEAPVINHSPVSSAPANSDVEISASVTDSTDRVDSVKLFYRESGYVGYDEVVMQPTSASDTYKGTIPKDEVTTAGVEYYIMASDNHSVRSYHGSYSNPHVINVGGAALNFDPVSPQKSATTEVMKRGTFYRWYILKDSSGNPVTNAEITLSQYGRNRTVKPDKNGLVGLYGYADEVASGSKVDPPVKSIDLIKKIVVNGTPAPKDELRVKVDVNPREYSHQWKAYWGQEAEVGVGTGVGIVELASASLIGGNNITMSFTLDRKGGSETLTLSRDLGGSIGGKVSVGPSVPGAGVTAEGSLSAEGFGGQSIRIPDPFSDRENVLRAQTAFVTETLFLGGTLGFPMLQPIISGMISTYSDAVISDYLIEKRLGMGVSGSVSAGANIGFGNSNSTSLRRESKPDDELDETSHTNAQSNQAAKVDAGANLIDINFASGNFCIMGKHTEYLPNKGESLGLNITTGFKAGEINPILLGSKSSFSKEIGTELGIKTDAGNNIEYLGLKLSNQSINEDNWLTDKFVRKTYDLQLKSDNVVSSKSVLPKPFKTLVENRGSGAYGTIKVGVDALTSEYKKMDKALQDIGGKQELNITEGKLTEGGFNFDLFFGVGAGFKVGYGQNWRLVSADRYLKEVRRQSKGTNNAHLTKEYPAKTIKDDKIWDILRNTIQGLEVIAKDVFEVATEIVGDVGETVVETTKKAVEGGAKLVADTAQAAKDGIREISVTVGKTVSSWLPGSYSQSMQQQGRTLPQAYRQRFKQLNEKFSASAQTVGKAAFVNATDKDGNQVKSFSPMEFTAYYTDEQLSKSGLTAIENKLQIFKWDYDKREWQLVGGQADPANNTVTTQITKPGIYIAGYSGAMEKSATLDEGWNLVSIPGKPQNTDPEEALGDDIDPLYMYQWDPATDKYIGGNINNSNLQLKAGASYWIYSWINSTEIDLKATKLSSSSIQLNAKGWQMVGGPFSVNWGDVKVDGIKLKNETSGSSYAGPLKPYIFSYSEGNNEYNLVQPSDWNDLRLGKWEGYWIKTTKSNVKLGFEKGDSISASASALRSNNQNILVDPEGKGVSLPPPPPMKPSKVEGLQAIASPTLVRDSGGVTFAVRSDRPVDGLQVEVLTANGKNVWNKDTNKSKLTWDTEGVANGIYLYTVSARVDGKLKQAGIGKLLVLK